MSVRQTSCRLCGQDIEGFSPYRRGEWRDRGNNTHCPDDSGRVHAPTKGETIVTTDRKVRGTKLTTYNWVKVPRQLLVDAQKKCKRQEPPISLKWKLIELLRAWVYPGTTS